MSLDYSACRVSAHAMLFILILFPGQARSQEIYSDLCGFGALKSLATSQDVQDQYEVSPDQSQELLAAYERYSGTFSRLNDFRPRPNEIVAHLKEFEEFHKSVAQELSSILLPQQLYAFRWDVVRDRFDLEFTEGLFARNEILRLIGATEDDRSAILQCRGKIIQKIKAYRVQELERFCETLSGDFRSRLELFLGEDIRSLKTFKGFPVPALCLDFANIRSLQISPYLQESMGATKDQMETISQIVQEVSTEVRRSRGDLTEVYRELRAADRIRETLSDDQLAQMSRALFNYSIMRNGVATLVQIPEYRTFLQCTSEDVLHVRRVAAKNSRKFTEFRAALSEEAVEKILRQLSPNAKKRFVEVLGERPWDPRTVGGQD